MAASGRKVCKKDYRQEEELINSQQPAASDNNANPDGTSTGDTTTGSDASGGGTSDNGTSGGGTVNASDVAMLAALIQCEAGDESYEGKLAVGSVVMNRVDSSYFPDTVVGVIYQSGQFSPVASGRFAVVLSSGADASCVQAATEVLAGTRTLNCLYFRRNNGLINGTVIGNHVFYQGKLKIRLNKASFTCKNPLSMITSDCRERAGKAFFYFFYKRLLKK